MKTPKVLSNFRGSHQNYPGFDIQYIELIETPCGSSVTPTPGSSSSGGGSTGGNYPDVELNGNRIGPVSMYGGLVAGTLSNGQGRIFGTCPEWNKTPVKVRGMSLFWSIDGYAEPFYSEAAVDAMVKDMKIEVIRFAMGTDDSDWGGFAAGYGAAAAQQEAKLDEIVKAAIKNDIYVIIDWHSHMAHTETALAKSFFSKVAQKYGKYNNVIFEIYNEPACSDATPTNGWTGNGCPMTTWPTIKTYANSVIPEIRKYSNNLIVVGTPSWSSDFSSVTKLSYDNVAYTYHYYASEHSVTLHPSSMKSAIGKGMSVFVTEWGTCMSDGDGTVSSAANSSWQSLLDSYDLSAANWSATVKNESCSAFKTGGTQFMGKYNYTTSGSLVKGYIANSVPTTYTKCSNAVSGGGSNTKSSSSTAVKPASSSSSVVVPLPGRSSSSVSAPIGGNEGDTPASSSSAEKVEIQSDWKSDNTDIESDSPAEVVIGDVIDGGKRTAYIEVDVKKGTTYTVIMNASADEKGTDFVVKVLDADGNRVAQETEELGVKRTKVTVSFKAEYSGKFTVKLQSTTEESDIYVENFRVLVGDLTPIMKNVVQRFQVDFHGDNLRVLIPRGSMAKLQVFDVMGHLVMGRSVEGMVPVSLEGLPRGNYVVRVSRPGFAATTSRINLK